MAGTKPQNAAILSLPPEILEMIWVQLSRVELKTTRLSCRFLNKLGTPTLFAEFRLFPHIRSFERLVSIAESEHVRHHVRSLSYFPDFNGALPRFVKQIESVWSSEVTTVEKERVLAHARFLESQTLSIDVVMDSLVQAEYLVRVFPRLDNLEAIRLFELTSEESMLLGDDELPHIYAQMKQETCGQYRHMRLPMDVMGIHEPATGTCAQLLLVASGKLQNPLQHLEFEGLTWVRFLQGGDFAKNSSFYNKHFANLKTLRLCGDSYNVFPLPGLLMQNLQHLLKMATSLERLEISVDKGINANLAPTHHRIISQVKRISMFDSNPWGRQRPVTTARLTWATSLRQLVLHGLRCTASEFKNVLRPCMATLELLRLDEIELLPEDGQPGTPRACWVKVMKWMQRHLVKLKSIEFRGRITNGGMQTWIVTSNPFTRYEDCLLERVCHFFLKGGPCPLDAFAIKAGAYDFMKDTLGAQTPDYVYEDEEYEGDSSWQMEYDESYNDEDDDDEHDSLMDDGWTDSNGFVSDEELDEDDIPWLYNNEYW